MPLFDCSDVPDKEARINDQVEDHYTEKWTPLLDVYSPDNIQHTLLMRCESLPYSLQTHLS